MKFLAAIFLLCSLAVKGQQYYPIKNMLGVNVHNWDLSAHPDEANSATKTAALRDAIINTGFSWLRLYADSWAYKSDDNTTYKFNPQGNGYLTDDAIISLKKRNPNLKVNLCYQNAPKNIQKEWTQKNTQYRHPNTDQYNPSTWSELAHDMAVIAARGGSNSNVPDYPVYVSPNWWEPKQIMLKGAGLYDQIEGGNEYDNNWSNDEPLTQYAALWNTVYDSVKKVDPNILVSTTGVMTEDPKILTDAIAAGGRFDKYQFHCYPWGWSKDIASALPPEMNMIPAAKKVVAVSNGIPCVIGEWGYDLNEQSWIGVTPFSNYTGEEIRSYWITRSLLGFARVGIESAFYYRIYQDYGLLNDSNSTAFETSSLFIKDDQGNITRRLSGDVYNQLSGFGDYVFDAPIVENDSVIVYRFKNGSKYLYTGWTIEKVSLVNKWNSNRASFTERKSNYTFPTGVNVTLTSKPVFVAVQSPLPIKLVSFTAQKINQAVVLKWIVQDADKIEVERSTDGITWTNLGEGIFNKLVDMHPLPGKNYYRLKMYEGEGFSYSPIRTVDFKKQIRAVYVIDALGRIVHEEKTDKSLVEMEHQLKLARGVYLLRSENETRKFIKQ